MPTKDDSMPANISQSSWNITINGTEESGGRTSVMFTGYINTQNNRVWSLVNPQVYVEVGSWDPFLESHSVSCLALRLLPSCLYRFVVIVRELLNSLPFSIITESLVPTFLRRKTRTEKVCSVQQLHLNVLNDFLGVTLQTKELECKGWYFIWEWEKLDSLI